MTSTNNCIFAKTKFPPSSHFDHSPKACCLNISQWVASIVMYVFSETIWRVARVLESPAIYRWPQKLITVNLSFHHWNIHIWNLGLYDPSLWPMRHQISIIISNDASVMSQIATIITQNIHYIPITHKIAPSITEIASRIANIFFQSTLPWVDGGLARPRCGASRKCLSWMKLVGL